MVTFWPSYRVFFLAFIQGFATAAVDGAVVDKYILTTGLLDKTKTLLIIEPLDGSFNLFRHLFLLTFSAVLKISTYYIFRTRTGAGLGRG